jgi:hypothetical protein
MRQAQNLINCIEDAALTKQDLYVTYIDFSSTFNVVSHTLLLGTWHVWVSLMMPVQRQNLFTPILSLVYRILVVCFLNLYKSTAALYKEIL